MALFFQLASVSVVGNRLSAYLETNMGDPNVVKNTLQAIIISVVGELGNASEFEQGTKSIVQNPFKTTTHRFLLAELISKFNSDTNTVPLDIRTVLQGEKGGVMILSTVDNDGKETIANQKPWANVLPPSKPTLSVSNPGTLTTGQITDLKLKLNLVGVYDGGEPLKRFSILQSKKDVDGTMDTFAAATKKSDSTSLVNASITAANLKLGYIEVAISNFSHTKGDQHLFVCSLDNGKFEGDLSDILPMNYSNDAPIAEIKHMTSFQSNDTSNKLKTLATVSLPLDANNSLWDYAHLQYRLDSATANSWVAGATMPKAIVLAQLIASNTFSIPVDYLSDAYAGQSIEFRLVLSGSAAPTLLDDVSSPESVSNIKKAISNVSKQSNTLELTSKFLQATNEYEWSCATTIQQNVGVASLTQPVIKKLSVSKNGVLYKKFVYYRNPGDSNTQTDTFRVPVATSKSTDKWTATVVWYKFLNGDDAASVNPQPELDFDTKRPIITFGKADSQTVSPQFMESSLPTVEQLKMSDFELNSKNIAILSFKSPNKSKLGDLVIDSLDFQVSGDSEFTNPIIVRGDIGAPFNKIKTIAAQNGDISEFIQVAPFDSTYVARQVADPALEDAVKSTKDIYDGLDEIYDPATATPEETTAHTAAQTAYNDAVTARDNNVTAVDTYNSNTAQNASMGGFVRNRQFFTRCRLKFIQPGVVNSVIGSWQNLLFVTSEKPPAPAPAAPTILQRRDGLEVSFPSEGDLGVQYFNSGTDLGKPTQYILQLLNEQGELVDDRKITHILNSNSLYKESFNVARGIYTIMMQIEYRNTSGTITSSPFVSSPYTFYGKIRIKSMDIEETVSHYKLAIAIETGGADPADINVVAFITHLDAYDVLKRDIKVTSVSNNVWSVMVKKSPENPVNRSNPAMVVASNNTGLDYVFAPI